MERKKILLVLFTILFLSSTASALIIDSFEDGNLLTNPVWETYSGACSFSSGTNYSQFVNGVASWEGNVSSLAGCNSEFIYTTLYSADQNNVSSYIRIEVINQRTDIGLGKDTDIITLGPSNLVYARSLGGDPFILVITGTSFTGVKTVDVNKWYFVRLDNNAFGASFSIKDLNGDLVENIFGMKTVPDHNSIFLGNLGSPNTVGKIYADDVGFNEPGLILDVNKPMSSTTYGLRFQPFQYRIYDSQPARCTEFNLDVNNVVGSDNNLLFRHTGISSASIDANYYLLNLEGTQQAIFTGVCDLNSATIPLENLMNGDANIFDFNGGQGKAFDDNRYWVVGEDANSLKVDSNSDFVKAGSFSLKIDVNILKIITTSSQLNNRINYNPPSTWDLTDYNSGWIEGWICIPNLNNFVSTKDLFPNSIDENQYLEFTLFDTNTQKNFRYNFQRSEFQTGCTFLKKSLLNNSTINGGQRGTSTELDWTAVDQFNMIIRDNNVNNSSFWLDGWQIVKGTPINATLTKSITLDLNAPSIYLFDNNVNNGFVSSAAMDVRLGCTDSLSSTLQYRLTLNNSMVFDSNLSKDTNQTVNTIPVDGDQNITFYCTDSVGRTSSDSNHSTIITKTFSLIDEETGNAFDLSNVSGLIAREYDTNSSFNFKTAGVTNRMFIWDSDNTVRFDFNYSSGIRLSREFNTTILGDMNNVRVCAARLQDFFEVVLISNSKTAVWVKNDFANCYSLADYTKYGLQGALIATAYLINTPYTLYSIDTLQKTSTVLTQLDGSKAASVNLDLLIFNLTKFNVSFQDDYITANRISDSNILQIAYINNKGENTAVTMNIYSNNSLITTTTNTATPNSLTVNFNLTDHFDSNVYKVEIVKTLKDGTSETITQYVGQQSGAGKLQPQFAVIAAIGILFAGLTLVASRFTIGWFGIAIGAIALLFLGNTVFSLWYVQFLSFITVFIIIFIGVAWSRRGFQTG